jgi:hypothetical protein
MFKRCNVYSVKETCQRLGRFVSTHTQTKKTNRLWSSMSANSLQPISTNNGFPKEISTCLIFVIYARRYLYWQPQAVAPFFIYCINIYVCQMKSTSPNKSNFWCEIIEYTTSTSPRTLLFDARWLQAFNCQYPQLQINIEQDPRHIIQLFPYFVKGISPSINSEGMDHITTTDFVNILSTAMLFYASTQHTPSNLLIVDAQCSWNQVGFKKQPWIVQC